MAGTMENQKLVVLGGSSGMGLATARAAIAQGASAIIAGRDPDRLAQASAALGERCEARQMDASAPDAVADFFAKCGAVDHIYSTLGDYADDKVLQADLAGIETAMQSRFRSAVLIARHAAGRIRPGGSITFTSGISAWKPMGSVAAAASCAAVESMARTLAIGLAPVRVNCISPGFIRTGLNAATPQASVDRLAERIPVGRPGYPEDIASAALFLMQNGYVTGVTIAVDGGLRLT